MGKKRVLIDTDQKDGCYSLKRTSLGLRSFNGRETEMRDRVTLQTVFNSLDRTRRPNLRPRINARVREFGRSILIAKHPQLYQKVDGQPGSNKRFLVDECLPPTFSRELWRDFGAATHPNYEGLAKSKDPQVWQWAKGNDINTLFSADSAMQNEKIDLCLIALKDAYDTINSQHIEGQPYKLPGFPMIVAFKAKYPDQAVRQLRANVCEIQNHLERRRVPVILVNQKGIQPGPSYKTLVQKNWDQVLEIARRL